MFLKNKRNRCKTTRQTLHTEQLEPKAMFSVSPVEPVVALDVGPVNQANVEDCMVIEPVFNVGEDGRMVIEPVFNVGGSASPGLSTDLRSENHFVFEVPKNDSGITLHASANPHAGPEGFIKLGDIKGDFQLTQRIGGSASPGGDNVFMPKPNRISGTAGPGGTSFFTGVNSLAQANQAPSLTSIRDADVASESVAGSSDPGGDDVFMPKPNRIAGSANPGGDDVFMPKPNLGVSLHDSVHCLVGDIGKAPFTTGAGGVHRAS